MKVSIITVVYNNREFLADAIESVKKQSYNDLEYIVVDGGSTDGSVDIIRDNEDVIAKWVSEPDRGIYDAMNKGIKMSSGEIIGFLNSDDLFYSEDVLEKIVSEFHKGDFDAIYGDLIYMDRNLKKRKRYWKSGEYKAGLFRKGWMPPHPAFFVKRKIYDKLGMFNTEFKISADYELMLRFIEKNRIYVSYVHEIIVKMRTGGVSNRGILNLIRKSLEDFKAWKVNGLKISFLIIFRKPLRKIGQLF